MLAMHFNKLLIWQKGMLLAKAIYESTKKFPKEELYGLVSQMRRAAVSIPANIAEGSQRTSNKEFANFVLIAKGSLAELETHLLLANGMKFIADDTTQDLQSKMEELNRMIHAFHSKLVTRVS